MANQGIERDFESEVRRIAALLWPEAQGQGAAMVEGRETDGVFVTSETVHIVEATTSRGTSKAAGDAGKTRRALQALARDYPLKGLKGWVVTKNDPTADQREKVLRAGEGLVSVVSLQQFRSQFIDAEHYLDLRKNHAFGSARNLTTNDFRAGSLDRYVPSILTPIVGSGRDSVDIDEISKRVDRGDVTVVLGDYGSGKSMTLLELHKRLERDYLKGKADRFPLYLNLREHSGQSDPAEALHRHAASLGFNFPGHLVRAWRAGLCSVILDGFDEVAPQGLADGARELKMVRNRTMALVRAFLDQSPPDIGVIVAGREHYFDGPDERRSALGIGRVASRRVLEVEIADFTADQVEEYLDRQGLSESLPTWLPTRPLLVGSLAVGGLLDQVLEREVPPSEGWDVLLDAIARREAQVDIGLSDTNLRAILERIASKARSTEDGLGPITRAQIDEAVLEVLEYRPEENATQVVLRLAGLAPAVGESRRFIDPNLADAARAADVVKCALNPYDDAMLSQAIEWEVPLGTLGQGVAHRQLKAVNASGAVPAAIHAVQREPGTSVLSADLVGISCQATARISELVVISHVALGQLELAQFDSPGSDYSNVRFDSCLIQQMMIDAQIDIKRVPRFVNCIIGNVVGPVGEADLPSGVFQDCEFESFEEAVDTNAGVISNESLPIGVRILVMVLRKLFVQAGAGRKENGLMRGMDQATREHVPSILDALTREGVVRPVRHSGEDIWLPIRSMAPRVYRILESPTSGDDRLLNEARTLSSVD